jgi:hypothetical protein
MNNAEHAETRHLIDDLCDLSGLCVSTTITGAMLKSMKNPSEMFLCARTTNGEERGA